MILREDEVHVWQTALDDEETPLRSLESVLSEDELARAGRFHFARDRNRFVTCRGILRLLLGNYLGCPPSGLNFRYSPQGKPYLETERGLEFNLSHSRGTAFIAFSLRREIGIDVECVRHDFDVEPLASRFFSRQETNKLLRLPAPLRHEAFIRCWTRKEAYLKARGAGLSIALDQFEVSLLPDEPAALLNVVSNPNEVCQWSLKEIASGPVYLAALAVPGHRWSLNHFEWSQ